MQLKLQARPEKFSRKLLFSVLLQLSEDVTTASSETIPQTYFFGLGRMSCDVFTFPHPVFKQNRFTELERVGG